MATIPVEGMEILESWQRTVERMRLDTDTRPQAIAPREAAFAISRSTGEIRSFYSKAIASAQVGGVRISWGKLETVEPKVRRGDKWVPRYENWFEEISLCIIQTQEVARFSREVSTDRFNLKSKSDVADALYTD